MNNGYTHFVSYEVFNKLLQMWVPGTFRTFESETAHYKKVMSKRRGYRNVIITAI